MGASSAMGSPTDEAVIADTVRWLERAVIGLNLCPFAKAVHAKQQIHYAIARADTVPELLDELRGELAGLVHAQSALRDTTLWILPTRFPEFLEFNTFCTEAQQVLDRLDLVGVLQIATFHPAYQFAGTTPDDITNYTNRAPYPMLHLLRERQRGPRCGRLPAGRNHLPKKHANAASPWSCWLGSTWGGASVKRVPAVSPHKKPSRVPKPSAKPGAGLDSPLRPGSPWRCCRNCTSSPARANSTKTPGASSNRCST